MTLSKQVSRQGLVLQRVMLTWGPAPRYTGEETVSEAHTPCWGAPGVKPRTSPEFPAATASSDLPH